MKNLKVRAKITLSFAIVLLVVLLLGVVSLMQVKTIKKHADIITSNSIPSVSSIWVIRHSVAEIESYALESMVVQSQSELDTVNAEIKATRATLDNAVADYLKLNPDDKAVIDEMNRHLDDVTKFRGQILEQCSKFTEEGKQAAYRIYKNDYSPAFAKTVECAMKLNDQVNNDIINGYNGMNSTYRMALIIIAVFIIGALIITIVFTIVLSKQMTAPITQIEEAMGYVAAGEFGNVSIDYVSRDELGSLSDSVRSTVSNLEMLINDMANMCNELGNGNFVVRSGCHDQYIGQYKKILDSIDYIRDTLSGTIVQIDQSSTQVLAGSQQVSDGAQNLSQGATEQASAIQELAATINELSEKIQNNAQNAAVAEQMTAEVGSGIAESNEHMQNLMNAMKEINATASDIEKIIKTIEDIAFQTNILALNAAVEAARAGEAGKGFAVVADEVRNLAGKSAEAAKNTTGLIGSTIKAIESGTEQANSTAESLEAVVDKASTVADRVREISDATEQQATAISQIGTGIDQISAVVQTNSATAEQSAAASEELSGQANMLKDLIEKFKLADDNANSADLSFYNFSTPSASYSASPARSSVVKDNSDDCFFTPDGDDKY